jgi:hypothetical protein
VSDDEDETLFEVEVEPIPLGWVRLLSKFRTGKEIPVTWDES